MSCYTLFESADKWVASRLASTQPGEVGAGVMRSAFFGPEPEKPLIFASYGDAFLQSAARSRGAQCENGDFAPDRTEDFAQ